MEFWDADREAKKGTVVLSGPKCYFATPRVALGSEALASLANIAGLAIWNFRTYPNLLKETSYFNRITR